MNTMTKYDLEPITKTFYDALEEGTVLGRKCTRCGHIEFPPYLCCNACGNLDTEWVDLTNVRGVVKQALPTRGAFGDPDFRNAHGDYFAVEVVLPNCDPVGTSLLHVDYDKYAEFDKLVSQTEVKVKPLIIQDEDTKIVVWELEGDSEFKKIPEIKAAPKASEKPKAAAPAAAQTGASAESDEITKTVIACAADAYGVDESAITPATDIREELSNESMKMIVMISSIEDETNVTIEIQEANNLYTIADFANRVKEELGYDTTAAPAASAAKAAAPADSPAAGTAEDLDEVAKTVIACAADAYGVDESEIALATDIREKLSNESMKMIVMISSIEDETNVTIEIQEANNLYTIADFVRVVRERM